MYTKNPVVCTEICAKSGNSHETRKGRGLPTWSGRLPTWSGRKEGPRQGVLFGLLGLAMQALTSLQASVNWNFQPASPLLG